MRLSRRHRSRTNIDHAPGARWALRGGTGAWSALETMQPLRVGHAGEVDALPALSNARHQAAAHASGHERETAIEQIRGSAEGVQ